MDKLLIGSLLEKGIVIKSTGSQYLVKTDDGSVITCGIKGRMRQEDIRTTNPVAVGDYVFVDIDQEGGVIDSVMERKNYIVRRSSNLSKQAHVLAANVDQAVLLATINYPVTTSIFIDRFLATAEAYRIPVVIVFNKIDRYDRKHLNELEQLRALYESIGYRTEAVSAKNGDDLTIIKELLRDKVSVLAGHSGVGKSTIINKIEPGLNLKTAEISAYHQQGRHTTSFAEMHQLSFGGYIIDTPGVRGFGLIDMEKEEISHFFREIFEVSKGCQFNNCIHQREPGCAVKAAVEEGVIALSRYQSYLNILMNNDEKYR